MGLLYQPSLYIIFSMSLVKGCEDSHIYFPCHNTQGEIVAPPPRRRPWADYNLEIGAGLGALAGKGWRNSVMQRRIYGRLKTPSQVLCLDPQISRLTKSAKKEAEDWARQTKRTLVMEMIKQRKHTWISRPKRQVRSFAKIKVWPSC